jgi:hypothetical protein
MSNVRGRPLVYSSLLSQSVNSVEQLTGRTRQVGDLLILEEAVPAKQRQFEPEIRAAPVVETIGNDSVRCLHMPVKGQVLLVFGF